MVLLICGDGDGVGRGRVAALLLHPPALLTFASQTADFRSSAECAAADRQLSSAARLFQEGCVEESGVTTEWR